MILAMSYGTWNLFGQLEARLQDTLVGRVGVGRAVLGEQTGGGFMPRKRLIPGPGTNSDLVGGCVLHVGEGEVQRGSARHCADVAFAAARTMLTWKEPPLMMPCRSASSQRARTFAIRASAAVSCCWMARRSSRVMPGPDSVAVDAARCLGDQPAAVRLGVRRKRVGQSFSGGRRLRAKPVDRLLAHAVHRVSQDYFSLWCRLTWFVMLAGLGPGRTAAV